MHWPSRVRALVATMVVAVTVLAGLVASRTFHHDSRIEQALQALPSQTLIANFTDWAEIRRLIDADVSSRSARPARAAVFSEAYDRDYATTSLLGAFDQDMATPYGWTVLDSEWEMYGQSRDGAVEVVRMPDDFDLAAADRALARLGYSAPDDHGVRVADDQTLAAVASGLTPQLTAVAVLPDEDLIVTSDAAAYAGLAVETINGEQDGVLDEDGVAAMAAALGETSVSALVDVGSYACTATGFQDADPGQQALARRRIEAVGGVHRIRGITRSIDPRSRLTVVLDFADAAQAEADSVRRTELARGDAPDQGGTFEERFAISAVDARGEVLVLVLSPRSDDSQLLRDLGRGGLLFASC